jgi:predicted DNA-binding protein (UPF0251 family)
VPRTPTYEFNAEVALEWMEEQALRLTDLHRLTKEADEEGKGVSLALLSELLSPTAQRTTTSLRTIRLVAKALGIRRPMILAKSEPVAA